MKSEFSFFFKYVSDSDFFDISFFQTFIRAGGIIKKGKNSMKMLINYKKGKGRERKKNLRKSSWSYGEEKKLLSK